MAILRTVQFFLFLIALFYTPNKLAAIEPVQQTFIIPSSGNNTYNRFRGTAHDGVDIQDGTTRPSVTSELCLAEPGSVNNLGEPITRGNYNGDNQCDDWRGAVVNAASSGQVTIAGELVNYSPHVVRIDHGTMADGRRVETQYLHLGTKVRDGRDISAGEPRQSFITGFRPDFYVHVR